MLTCNQVYCSSSGYRYCRPKQDLKGVRDKQNIDKKVDRIPVKIGKIHFCLIADVGDCDF